MKSEKIEDFYQPRAYFFELMVNASPFFSFIEYLWSDLDYLEKDTPRGMTSIGEAL